MSDKKLQELLVAIHNKCMEGGLDWENASWATEAYTTRIGGINVMVAQGHGQVSRPVEAFGTVGGQTIAHYAHHLAITDENGNVVETIEDDDFGNAAELLTQIFRRARQEVNRVDQLIDRMLNHLK